MSKPAILLAIVALLSAVVGHVTIDVLGDFMLPHDTYDDLNHTSRGVVALVALGPTLIGIAWAARALIREAGGSENAFCHALRGALPTSAFAFTLAAIAGATLVLCAMEGGDALLAGQPIDDPSDLFGGSIAFGGTIVALVAGGLSLMAMACVRRLAQLRIVVGIVVALLRRTIASSVKTKIAFDADLRLIFQHCDICHRVAGRAPPLLHGIAST